jgi:hypothetical protein
MFKKPLTAITVAAPVLLAGIGIGNATGLGQYGYWDAFSASGIESGQPTCGVDTRYDYQGGVSGVVTIKYQGGDQVFIQVYKRGWYTPPGQPLTIQMQVDNGVPMTFTGRGLAVAPRTRAAGFGAFEIDIPWSDGLIRSLAAGGTLRISFPDGTKAPWWANLYGVRGALNAMGQCSLALRSPTQTYDAVQVPASQVF